MNAATPPRACASAMTCWQTVVLPDDSGPKISVIRPRGMPPTPRARSRAMEPVGMKSTCCRWAEPSFMIEPDPNCFSMERIAASTARVRSATAFSPLRSLATTIVASRSCPWLSGVRGRRAVRWYRSGVGPVLLVPAGLPLLLDELDVHRRLGERLHLGLTGLVLGLLLGFAVWSISRAHRGFLRVHWTVCRAASLRLTRGFVGAGPARADPQLLSHLGEASGLDGGPDSGHEV